MKHTYCAVILTVLNAGIALSQPKIQLDKHVIDMGSMYTGEKKAGKIIVTNVGNDTLHIYYVGTSCGCTTVKSPKEFLAPGHSDVIGFEFSAFETQGTIEKYIMIYTNDTTAKDLSVKLFARMNEVLRPIADLNITFVESVVNRKPATKRIAMKNVSGVPIMILGDSVSSASIAAKMDKSALQPNDTLNIDVTVIPEKPGPSSEALYILTDQKAQPRAEIKITLFGTQ